MNELNGLQGATVRGNQVNQERSRHNKNSEKSRKIIGLICLLGFYRSAV